jgi:RNA polymerase sigma-70 factor, ECF subfamily
MPTDEELVLDIRRGETGAFDELYRRYSRRLFGYILRLIRDRDRAEDLFQEVFMQVLADRSYDSRSGPFAGWLFAVARNRCLSSQRDSKRQAGKLEQLAGEGPAALAPSPEQEAQHGEHFMALSSALAALSPAHQDALLLKQVGNLTYRQIAEIQAVPEGTAKSRLHHAIRALRQVLCGAAGPLQEADHEL